MSTKIKPIKPVYFDDGNFDDFAQFLWNIECQWTGLFADYAKAYFEQGGRGNLYEDVPATKEISRKLDMFKEVCRDMFGYEEYKTPSGGYYLRKIEIENSEHDERS